jgi:NAD(P)-dependent dehydrogenase (short-subunit alcohol dehydrogenase family)
LPKFKGNIIAEQIQILPDTVQCPADNISISISIERLLGHYTVSAIVQALKNYSTTTLLTHAQHYHLAGDKYYNAWTFYGQSKFANLLFAKELARRFSGTKKTAYAVHPGVIKTNLARSMNPVLQFVFGLGEHLFLKTVEQGAATECYLATNPSVLSDSGKYFADSNVKAPRKDAENMDLAKKLWEVSEKIVAKL